MLSFYTLPQAACVAISAIAACAVIIQAVAFVFNLYRYRAGLAQKIENALEAAILLQTLLMALLMGHVLNGLREDLITSPGYDLPRLLVFISILLPAALVCLLRKTWRPLPAAAAAALTLPAVEAASGSLFMPLYGAALLFWLLRGVLVCLARYRALRTGISALSIKEAIDALRSGILFCESDGYIILINRRMWALMKLLTGGVGRDGRAFYARLSRGNCHPGCEKSELDGRMVYRLPDRSVWMFAENVIHIKRRTYYQISAADVTGQWDAAERLREQNDELDRQSGELIKTISNLHEIYRREETLRAKSRIHDILGQRIAVLIRSLRGNDRPDQELLDAFADGLMNDLREVRPDRSFAHEIELIIEMFAGIGVRVTFCGEFPANPEASEVFMDVITEGVTNAVRHGFSAEIDITCAAEGRGWTLRISNSGIAPEGPVSEGGGISGMRRKLAGMGGRLGLQTEPLFVLTAVIPEGTEECREF